MSACYTIELNMKFKSPESMSDAVRSLQEYIKKDAETDYDLESYAADGIGTENIDDLMKIFLSDRKRQRITITDSGEWKNYSTDFNASYGWESVLVKMFKILGVYLANGSQLDISIDNDYNGLVIRNGICKQINLKVIVTEIKEKEASASFSFVQKTGSVSFSFILILWRKEMRKIEDQHYKTKRSCPVCGHTLYSNHYLQYGIPCIRYTCPRCRYYMEKSVQRKERKK